jgi:hypothetical protein
LTGVYVLSLEEDLMNKIVALVLALSLMATMVFAEPVVLAPQLKQTTDYITEAEGNAPLFADVEASQLAALDAAEVEGEGIVTGAVFAVGGAAIGALGGAIYGFASNFQSGPSAAISGAKSGAVVGAIVCGATFGLIGLVSSAP